MKLLLSQKEETQTPSPLSLLPTSLIASSTLLYQQESHPGPTHGVFHVVRGSGSWILYNNSTDAV